MLEKSNPFVSVIVPVLNDSERLKTCLESIENQTHPPDLYEVIVVDNGSDQSIEPIVAAFSHARATHEGKLSSYAARNKGISLARGDILAFTDSDCIPAPDWIEKGVASLISVPNCGLIGGCIEVFAQNRERPTMTELYEIVLALPQRKFIKEYRFAATANMFTFRHVFAKVGTFNPKLKSSGDMEWGQRVYAQGYAVAYASQARVMHPARRSLRELHARNARIAGGLYDGRPKNLRIVLGIDKDLLKWLLPPLSTTMSVLSDPRLKSMKEKAQAAFAVFFVKYTIAVERFRLNLGGRSRR